MVKLFWEEYQMDWEGFDNASEERWIKHRNGYYSCTKHKTFFRPHSPDGEPCWQCYDEFYKKI